MRYRPASILVILSAQLCACDGSSGTRSVSPTECARQCSDLANHSMFGTEQQWALTYASCRLKCDPDWGN